MRNYLYFHSYLENGNRHEARLQRKINHLYKTPTQKEAK
jgi:hypothetical protein